MHLAVSLLYYTANTYKKSIHGFCMTRCVLVTRDDVTITIDLHDAGVGFHQYRVSSLIMDVFFVLTIIDF